MAKRFKLHWIKTTHLSDGYVIETYANKEYDDDNNKMDVKDRLTTVKPFWMWNDDKKSLRVFNDEFMELYVPVMDPVARHNTLELLNHLGVKELRKFQDW